MTGSFGLVRGDGVHRVALRFRPPTSLRIGERRWRPGQTIEAEADGGLILRFEVNDLREVARFVMFWGDDCRILEPEELRDVVRERCRALLGA